MQPILRVLYANIVLLGLSAVAMGQQWTTPDGFLSVTPPDPARFNEIPSPPSPFVGLWISHDQSTRLGVMIMPIPPDVPLSQASVEEGLAKELGGRVTRLPTTISSGYAVWNMSGKSHTVQIRQAIVPSDGLIYKLLAVSVDGSDLEYTTTVHFLGSLAITRPAAVPVQLPPPPPYVPSGDPRRIPDQTLSKTIGGAGALLLIGVTLYVVGRHRRAAKTQR